MNTIRIRIRLGHESLDVALACLKGKDAARSYKAKLDLTVATSQLSSKPLNERNGLFSPVDQTLTCYHAVLR